MKNKELSYMGGNTSSEMQSAGLFFEMQDVIKKDFRRIQYMIESYQMSHAKECLMFFLNNIISNIGLNRFRRKTKMELNISLQDLYLVFSYYELDCYRGPIYDAPSIVILARDLSKIYLIHEVANVFRVGEESDTYSSYDITYCFTLNDKQVWQYTKALYLSRNELFSQAFENTSIFLRSLEESWVKNDACFYEKTADSQYLIKK